MKECSVLELSEKLENGGLTLIDVRQPLEFAGSRLAGAKLIPLGELGKRVSEIDRSNPIYMICRSGNRSSRAVRKLESLGFDNVTNVSGGMLAWKKQSLPYEADESPPWEMDRQVRLVAGLLILLGFILAAIFSQYFLVISVFVACGLVFSALTNTCTMALILARMPWNQRGSEKGIQKLDQRKGI